MFSVAKSRFWFNRRNPKSLFLSFLAHIHLANTTCYVRCEKKKYQKEEITVSSVNNLALKGRKSADFYSSCCQRDEMERTNLNFQFFDKFIVTLLKKTALLIF